ncbi:hypothetical protein D3C83_295270 [compost metagenome]
MDRITCRLAKLLVELPPWWTSNVMWKASARLAILTSGVMPPLIATSPRRKSVAWYMIHGAMAWKPP